MPPPELPVRDAAGRFITGFRRDENGKGTFRVFDHRTGQVKTQAEVLASEITCRDMQSGALRETLFRTQDHITCCALAADGVQFACLTQHGKKSSTRQQSPTLVQLGTGAVHTVAEEKDYRPKTLALSPDGLLLVLGGQQGISKLPSQRTGEVVIHHLATGRVQRIYFAQAYNISSVLFTPDGDVIIVPEMYWDYPAIVERWDPVTGLRRWQWISRCSHPRQIELSPDGRRLAIISSMLVQHWPSRLFHDFVGLVCMLDAGTGALLSEMSDQHASFSYRQFAFSATGTRCAVSGSPALRINDWGEVQVWERASTYQARNSADAQ